MSKKVYIVLLITVLLIGLFFLKNKSQKLPILNLNTLFKIKVEQNLKKINSVYPFDYSKFFVSFAKIFDTTYIDKNKYFLIGFCFYLDSKPNKTNIFYLLKNRAIKFSSFIDTTIIENVTKSVPEVPSVFPPCNNHIFFINNDNINDEVLCSIYEISNGSIKEFNILNSKKFDKFINLITVCDSLYLNKFIEDINNISPILSLQRSGD